MLWMFQTCCYSLRVILLPAFLVFKKNKFCLNSNSQIPILEDNLNTYVCLVFLRYVAH